MQSSFADIPIIRNRNPHTNRRAGDDTGYRLVPTSDSDAKNPDPLVIVNKSIRVHPVYAHGKTRGLCPYYGTGLGASKLVLVRKPVLEKLVEANKLLDQYGLELVVLDGFRPYNIQAALWSYLRAKAIKNEGLVEGALSFQEEIRFGILADEVGSYCAVVKNEAFYASRQELLTGENLKLVTHVAEREEMSPGEIAELYLTFNANLRRNSLTLDKNAPTAHGSGGAVDLWMAHKSTGQFCNLGSPFDYLSDSPVTNMDFFDRSDVSPQEYITIVDRDPVLKQYLRELGYESRTARAFYVAQRTRRILFNAMMSLGASFYAGECWHFQFGNERGGNQAEGELLGSGNACHALLNGKKEAVWGNAAAHALAQKIPGFYESIG